jgi:peptidoglycan glycosyltransferase
VQALVSMPTFDPNPLVSHDTEAAAAAYRRLEQIKAGPLKNRAMSETLSPGSTFKVIDSAAALENGYTPDTQIPAGSSYTPPQTTVPIRNAASGICPDSQVTLKQALTESCNTGFAQLGVKLGAEVLKDKARDFGFEDDDLVCGRANGDDGIKIAASRTGEMRRPDGGEDPAVVAQSAIGQNDVRMTPIQGALIAATVANDGRQMRPYIVQQLLGPDRRPIPTPQPDELRRPIDDSVAQALREMMISVVENGTGRNAQIDDHEVGGKTGTAEAGEDEPEHGWFIGFVRRDGQPLSAVAVLLENAGDGGSAEAARIAGNVMEAVIRDGRRGGD